MVIISLPPLSIYIHTVYIMHLGAFHVQNAPSPTCASGLDNRRATNHRATQTYAKKTAAQTDQPTHALLLRPLAARQPPPLVSKKGAAPLLRPLTGRSCTTPTPPPPWRCGVDTEGSRALERPPTGERPHLASAGAVVWTRRAAARWSGLPGRAASPCERRQQRVPSRRPRIQAGKGARRQEE
jgi:hypothetical protein